VAQSDSVQAF